MVTESGTEILDVWRETQWMRRVWWVVLAVGARGMLWIGVATWFVGLGSVLLPEAWLPAYLLVTCALWVLALIIVLILGVRYARRLTETR
jgi:hypothetical protein